MIAARLFVPRTKKEDPGHSFAPNVLERCDGRNFSEQPKGSGKSSLAKIIR
jgi:hypothetical protein